MIAFFSAVVTQVPPHLQIAPGPDELRASINVGVDRLLLAEAIGSAVERLHNRVVDLSRALGPKLCEDPEAAGVLSRADLFARAHRDAAQDLRAQSDRIARIAASPGLAAVVADERLAAELANLDARARHQARVHLEMAAWHRRYVAPKRAKCPSPVAPAPGLGATAAIVAIAGVGGGTLCPMNVPADGRVVIARGGTACYGVRACDCLPLPVAAGAVLGPPGR